MLVVTLLRKTGVRIHVATMSVALKRIGARRGSPKPIVRCPWSQEAKNSRLRQIERLIANLPPDEVVVYEDEIDIHLNPKIGLDWMVRGQQKEVVTPGQNEKRYLAGAQDVRTGELTWVEGDRKNSFLFILLLWELVQHYPDAKRIHVILDNYSIHTTEQVQTSLSSDAGRRIRLHFLPPYCPDHNKIERTWEDLHANVTRNHTRTGMRELMGDVRRYLRRRNHHHDITKLLCVSRLVGELVIQADSEADVPEGFGSADPPVVIGNAWVWLRRPLKSLTRSCLLSSQVLQRAQKCDDILAAQHSDHLTVAHHGQLVHSVAVHFLQGGPQLGLRVGSLYSVQRDHRLGGSRG
jgi:transposase